VVIIEEGTILVVGIPIYDEDKEDHKYKGKYKISAGVESSRDMKEGELYRFSADNSDRIEGTPKYILSFQ